MSAPSLAWAAVRQLGALGAFGPALTAAGCSSFSAVSTCARLATHACSWSREAARIPAAIPSALPASARPYSSAQADAGAASTPSSSQQGSSRPLLKQPPLAAQREGVPDPAACATLYHMAQHLQRHGHAYTLKHVAGAFKALAGYVHGRMGAAGGGGLGESEMTDAVVHANRLVQLARHQLQVEYDWQAVASSLAAISHLPGAMRPTDLSLPFLERLRASGYYHDIPTLPHSTLVELVHAMAKLKPWRASGILSKQRGAISQIRAKALVAIHGAAAELGAEELVNVAQAMARMQLTSHAFLTKALAERTAELGTDGLTAAQAARLAWSFGHLLDFYSEAYEGRMEVAAAEAEAAAAAGPDAESGTAEVQRVKPEELQLAMQAAGGVIAGVACRAFSSVTPLELVKLTNGLGRMRPTKSAAVRGFFDQAIPHLLAAVQANSLNVGAMADVLHAYHVMDMQDMAQGLAGAVEQNIISGGGWQVGSREAALLLQCYSPARAELWRLLADVLRPNVDKIYWVGMRDLHRALQQSRADPELLALVAQCIEQRKKQRAEQVAAAPQRQRR